MQTFANGLYSGAIYSLIAIGVTLVFHTSRIFPIGLVVAYTAAAYCSYAFVALMGLDLWLAVVLGIICAGMIGLLIERGLYRVLRKKTATPANCLLASLGLVVAFQSIISLLFGDAAQVLQPQPLVSSYSFFGAHLTLVQIITLGVSALIFAVTLFLEHKTTEGKVRRALAGDFELAKIVGLPIELTYMVVYFFGSVTVGIAALLSAFETNIVPTMGFGAILMGIIASVVGGIGSIKGALFGGILIGMAQHFGVLFIPTQWQDAIAFFILLVFLIFKPSGLFGRRHVGTST